MVAVICGSAAAVLQYLTGDLVAPGGFGLSRWMSGFVDIVGLPVLIPLLVYIVLLVFRLFSGNYDFANFILLWLIPVAILKALGWSSLRSPILLVMVPVLWTALAGGVSLFINLIMQYLRWYVAALCGLGIIALFFAAVSSYWALFSQQILLGSVLFFLALIPMLISVILDYIRSR